MESCSSRAIRVRSSSCSVRASSAVSRSAADGLSRRVATVVINSPSRDTTTMSSTSGTGTSNAAAQRSGTNGRKSAPMGCPTAIATSSTAIVGSQTEAPTAPTAMTIRASSQSTVRQRSPQWADGARLMALSEGSRSYGVSRNCA